VTHGSRVTERYLEAEKRIPLRIENFGTLMTQVSFVHYDGFRMDVPWSIAERIELDLYMPASLEIA
jgi:hypothetical protein